MESFVKLRHTVGGEEKDSLIVFQEPKEDGDKSIAANIVRRPLLKENIGFVYQEDRTERIRKI